LRLQQAAGLVNSVKPNAGFRNILKGFLDNAVTEINGSGGDYTCVNGVATWKERVDGQLTGKVLRDITGRVRHQHRRRGFYFFPASASTPQGQPNPCAKLVRYKSPAHAGHCTAFLHLIPTK
jgi:hypothetical protein